MKSIKHKLFISYTITIFLILSLLSGVSIYLFKQNKETKSLELIDTTYLQFEDLLYEKKNINIKEIDKYMDLSNLFLIIFENGKLVFTNESRFKTLRILEEIEYENKEAYEDHRDDEDHDEWHKRKDELKNKYRDFYDDGYIEIDDYVFELNLFELNDKEYEVYLGIDDRYLEQSFDDIYMTIIFSNLAIFLILALLGNILINKTINPLKLILEELKTLQETSDLSKRLKENKTNDEFEQLIDSFNKMLSNIESSVENIKQFSSDASHELRTPLTVIQGEIELIKNKEDVTKEQLEEVVNKVDVEQRKLQEIIKNFLLLSRLDKEALKHKTTSLDKVIFESIESNLEAIEEKTLELKLEIDENLEVSFDEKYLNIVVNNLLSNAVKYTKEGSITLKAKKEANKTYFEVIDTGIGISKEDINKIFERFYRVDKARTTTKNGIGLGLSIVKKICDRFEANIKIESTLDKGSCFRVEFINK